MLDNTDKAILAALTANSRISMKELGELVHLTGQAAANRVQKLEASGIITRYTITVKPDKAAWPLHAMIDVYLPEISQLQPFLSLAHNNRNFIKRILKTGGNPCYILECRFPATDSMNTFLAQLNSCTNFRLTMIISEE